MAVSPAIVLSGLALSFAACSSAPGLTTGPSSAAASSAASSASTGTSSGATTSTDAATSTSGASSTGAATSGGTTGTTGGSSAGSSTGATSGGATYVYIENNDPSPSNTNAILAFQRSGDTLVPLAPVASFPLGGAGQGNPNQIVNGPDDSDQEIILDAEHQRLYAVNQGSSTVAVLNINPDGSLTAIAGSPFPSGGDGPVSLALNGDTLYVVNKANDRKVAPSYTALSVGADGSLSPLSGFKPITTSVGASPSQDLITSDGLHMFGADFLGPLGNPPINPLRSFVITSKGGLVPAAGDPYLLPDVLFFGASTPASLALGLAVHPTQSILYVGFALVNQVGVYSYDETGVLTFVTSANLTGFTVCWLRVSADGSHLYAVNTTDASVSVLDIGFPRAPVEIQYLLLKDSIGMPFTQSGGAVSVTSAPFQETLSPDGTALFIVSQRVTTNASDTTSPGNVLHTLMVGADGTVSEPGKDIPLDVPPDARPQGVVAVQIP